MVAQFALKKFGEGIEKSISHFPLINSLPIGLDPTIQKKNQAIEILKILVAKMEDIQIIESALNDYRLN